MAQRFRQDQGSIYVEALVALAILSLALIPLVGTFLITPAAHRQAEYQTAALNLARAHLEALHALTPRAWDDLVSDTDYDEVNGQDYAIAMVVTQPEEALKQVLVTVSWLDPKGRSGEVSLATAVARRP